MSASLSYQVVCRSLACVVLVAIFLSDELIGIGPHPLVAMGVLPPEYGHNMALPSLFRPRWSLECRGVQLACCVSKLS